MYQNFNTRKRFITRVVTYFIMATAVIIGLAGTIVWLLGYRFDVQEARVERSSLLQFQTFPAGAKIAVNDVELGFTTPGRYDESKPGANTVKFWLDGYHDWVKTINLRATEVRWLNYTRLVPKDLRTDKVATFGGYHQSQVSPNGQWILLHETPSARDFKIIDISDPRNTRQVDLTLPEAILPLGEGETETFEIVEWDTSSNFVLIRRAVGERTEILRVDRRDDKNSLNLTRDFNLDMAQPHFLNGDNGVVFALVGTDIRRFEIGSKSVSAPLVSGVTGYDIYGDGKLAYVAEIRKNDQVTQEVGVHFRDKKYVVANYDEVRPTRASFTHHYRTDYLAIARGNELSVIPHPLDNRGEDDVADTTTVTLEAGADYLMHNGSGRFLVAGRGEAVATYDLETGEMFSFTLPGLTVRPRWIDDYHLNYVRDGRLVMTEFDGANSQTLVETGAGGVFSTNNEYLFTFKTVGDGVNFDRSRMVVN
ncbi:MAG: PEGA domain-containing protein [Candidatus Nomurabacteria bacterium]|jgi:hypothetical protein|nr:PEGA domain-containing protein [Candidatus Nomurabacteria bacterium]